MELVQEIGLIVMDVFNAIIACWNDVLGFLGIPLSIAPIEW